MKKIDNFVMCPQPCLVCARNRDEALEYGEIRSLRYRTNENNPRVREGPEYNNYVYPKKFDKFVLGYIVHVGCPYAINFRFKSSI